MDSPPNPQNRHQLSPPPAQTLPTPLHSYSTIYHQTIHQTTQRTHMIALHRQIFTTDQPQHYQQQIQSLAHTLQHRFPNIPLRSIIIQLYRHVLTSHKISPRDRSLRHMAVPQLYIQPRRGRLKIERKYNKRQTHPDVTYLQTVQLPPYHTIANPPANTYSLCILKLPNEEGEQQWWRVQQLRVLADIFTTAGYGLTFVRTFLHQHCMNKDRFKSLMGTIIRQCIRSLEQFLLSRSHTIVPLRMLSPRFINTLLLNIRQYFPQASVEIFTRAVRINCALRADPIREEEVLEFYQVFVVMLKKHFETADMVKQDAEAMHVRVKVTEIGIWGEEQDRFIAGQYSMGASVKDIQEELLERRPELAHTYYSCLGVRRRLFKILRTAIRKGNLLMLDSGLPEDHIVCNELELKKLLRSPKAYTVRLHLCQLFLNQDESPQFVHLLHKLLQDYRKGELPAVREGMGTKARDSSKDLQVEEEKIDMGQGSREDFDWESDMENLSQVDIDEDS